MLRFAVGLKSIAKKKAHGLSLCDVPGIQERKLLVKVTSHKLVTQGWVGNGIHGVQNTVHEADRLLVIKKIPEVDRCLGKNRPEGFRRLRLRRCNRCDDLGNGTTRLRNAFPPVFVRLSHGISLPFFAETPLVSGTVHKIHGKAKR